MIGVARVDPGDSDASEANRRLAAFSTAVSAVPQIKEAIFYAHHLVEDLAGVGLESSNHLELVRPTLGVLSRGALERNIESIRPGVGQSARASLGQLVNAGNDVLVLGEVDEVDLDVRVVLEELLLEVVEAPLDAVDRDEARGAAEDRPLANEKTDDTDTPDADDVALVDAGVFDLVERGDAASRTVSSRSRRDTGVTHSESEM